jgi:hypothetical protein
VGVKTYLVRFKQPGMIPQLVIADRAEIRGGNIVMLDANGETVAMFSAELVDSWITREPR